MPSLPVGVVPRFVDGYNGDYVIWNNGTVTSLMHKKPKSLSPGPTSGYLTVSLSYNGKAKTKYIHKLVAEHFIPNPENKPEVDHRDQVRTNNDVHNLRWATHAENNQNQGMQCNNTSGVTGVRLTKTGKFQSQIWANGKYHTKTFKTKHEAGAWYATMKAALHIGA